MARFIGKAQGSRGEAYRVGHKTQGITTQALGTDLGIIVHGSVDSKGNDVFKVYKIDVKSGRIKLINEVIDI